MRRVSRHPAEAHGWAVVTVLASTLAGAVAYHMAGFVPALLLTSLVAMLAGSEIQKRWP